MKQHFMAPVKSLTRLRKGFKGIALLDLCMNTSNHKLDFWVIWTQELLFGSKTCPDEQLPQEIFIIYFERSRNENQKWNCMKKKEEHDFSETTCQPHLDKGFYCSEKAVCNTLQPQSHTSHAEKSPLALFSKGKLRMLLRSCAMETVFNKWSRAELFASTDPGKG